MKRTKNEEKGQIVIILLLLMLVTLSIGLALTQKSVTDVTTSTQTEQSSRAFSAAEAGIEKALTGTIPSASSFPFENDSTAVVDSSPLLPKSDSKAAIEYPPFGRETTAQFWLTDYTSPSVDLYFGNEETADKPAVEIKFLMKSKGKFYIKTYYYDSDSARAPSQNGFTYISCGSVIPINTILGSGRTFYCSEAIGPIKDEANLAQNCPNSSVTDCKLILARVRFLYTKENHKMALAPRDSANFPPQVQIYNATGKAGQSEKQIQAYKVVGVVPPWFDFAVFSVDEIRK